MIISCRVAGVKVKKYPAGHMPENPVAKPLRAAEGPENGQQVSSKNTRKRRWQAQVSRAARQTLVTHIGEGDKTGCK